MRTPLEQAILGTLAWFDVVSYPLTSHEIHRYLYADTRLAGATQEDITDVLSHGSLAPYLEQREGFWFLKNREEIVDVRKRRLEISKGKWRIARRAVKLISWLPFIRMISVVNTVSYNNAKEDSDIDLFIIAESGRMFTARLFATLVLDLFRLRRHGAYVQDRACLSFYVSDTALSLEHLALPGGDPYLTYWHEWLIPLSDDRGTFERFLSANQWVTKQLPHAFTADRRAGLMRLNGILRLKKRLLEKLLGNTWIGHRLEAWAKKRQFARFAENTHSRSTEHGSAVIISETMLKFHESDRREEFRRRFEERKRVLYASPMEYVDVLSEDGTPTGERKPKDAVHRDGDLHKSVHVWLANQNGELLLQLRHPEKVSHPNLWDISAAGHMSSGETSLEAAMKETREELGYVVPPEAFQFLFSVRDYVELKDKTYTENEIHDVYLLSYQGSGDFTLQSDEVSEVRWIRPDAFEQELNNFPERFVPHAEEYRRILAAARQHK